MLIPLSCLMVSSVFMTCRKISPTTSESQTPKWARHWAAAHLSTGFSLCIARYKISSAFSHGLFREYKVIAAAVLTFSTGSSSRHSRATKSFSGKCFFESSSSLYLSCIPWSEEKWLVSCDAWIQKLQAFLPQKKLPHPPPFFMLHCFQFALFSKLPQHLVLCGSHEKFPCAMSLWNYY